MSDRAMGSAVREDWRVDRRLPADAADALEPETRNKPAIQSSERCGAHTASWQPRRQARGLNDRTDVT